MHVYLISLKIKISFLVGAGISASSGLPLFRGNLGKTNDSNGSEWLNFSNLSQQSDNQDASRFFSNLTELSSSARPSNFHLCMKYLSSIKQFSKVTNRNILVY